MKTALQLALLCLISSAQAGTGTVTEAKQTELLMSVLTDQTKYDKMMRPKYQVDVEISMFIDTISSISTESMDFDITVMFRQHWNDERLAWGTSSFDSVENTNGLSRSDGMNAVDPSIIDLMWIPDVFFVDEKDAKRHNIMRQNILLDIGPNGDIIYSDRLSLKLGCNMDFALFPFDQQLCEIKMEPYYLRKSMMTLKWKASVGASAADRAKLKGAIQMNAIELPSYEITKCYVQQDCVMAYITGEFACLSAFTEFTRDKKYYILNVYIPSTLCVLMAMGSFWVHLELASARVTIGFISFLTMINLMQYVNEDMPRVSYTKAIDFWMFFCLLIIFLTLVEFGLAHIAFRAEEDDRVKRRLTHSDADLEKLTHRENTQSAYIDGVSKIIFPIIFGVYMLGYTAYYAAQDPPHADQVGSLLAMDC